MANPGKNDGSRNSYARVEAALEKTERGVTDAVPEQFHMFEEEQYDENLGEDFEDTPWVPPSVELAEEYKRKRIYKEGIGDWYTLKITHVADLGVGLPLYFQFVKSAANYLLICTILSVPLFVYAMSGTNIPSQIQDSIGLYKLTFGNVGANPLSQSYFKDSNCTVNIATPGSTCIHFYGNEITSINASYIITAFELLQVIIFYFVLMFLRSKTKTFKLSTERQVCSVTDYSIMCRNVPPDCTEEMLVGHFSRLYPLDKPDWRGRPPLEGAKPVEDFDNTEDVMYYNTWVSEVNAHKRIGRFVTAFKEQQDLMTNILRSRATMKMYNERTCHASGPDIKRFLKAEKEMLLAGDKLDKLTEKISKQKNMVLRELLSEEEDAPLVGETGDEEDRGFAKNKSDRAKKSGKSTKSHKSGKTKSGKSIKADVRVVAETCAAFVIFQYSESMARCIEDYRMFEAFPMSLLTPSTLKLRGFNLQVKQAPQPDEMIWENIEVSEFQKRIRRLQTALYTLVLLILSFVAILQAQRASLSLSKKIPNTKLCSSDVPAVYTGSYLSRGVVLTRPPSASAVRLDQTCNALLQGSIYAKYTYGGVFADPVAAYDVNSCAAGNGYSPAGFCPHLDQPVFCPCISITSLESCHTSPCSSNFTGDSNKLCYDYSASLLGGCYCLSELSDTSTGSADSFKAVSSDFCKSFIESYLKSRGVVYCVSIVTVVMNMLLLSLQVYITRKELHASIDKEQGSLMIKIFISTYFNLAVVYILVFGSIPEIEVGKSFLQATYILQGSYEDFNSEWYGAVGTQFIIAFFLQGLTPIITNLVYYLIIAPLTRRNSLPLVKAYKSQSVVMQQDLNLLLVGPDFDITVATAQNLALFFFAMTYATALPLLMPLGFILLMLSYWTDKMLICRYYQRPPYSGTGVMKTVLECMFWAGLLRLLIGCWVFSNPDVFDYQSIYDVKSISGAAAYVQHAKGYLPEWMETRLIRTNVFPLVVLIMVILFCRLCIFIYQMNPAGIISSYFRCALYACRSNKIFAAEAATTVRGFDLFVSDDDLRQECAPFTQDYFKYVTDNTARLLAGHGFFKHMDLQLTDAEKAEGWQLREQGRYTIKQKHWTRIVRENQKVHNVNDVKKTFEVIADHGCHSYSLEKVPAYKLTMIGLREGTASMASGVKAPQRRVVSSKNGNQVVVTKLPSLQQAYEGVARRTSIVEDHMERQRRRSSVIDGHTAMQAAMQANYDYEAQQDEELMTEEQGRQEKGVRGLVSYDSLEEETAAGMHRQGSLFGTGLGSRKYFSKSDEADYEQMERDMQAEDFELMEGLPPPVGAGGGGIDQKNGVYYSYSGDNGTAYQPPPLGSAEL